MPHSCSSSFTTMSSMSTTAASVHDPDSPLDQTVFAGFSGVCASESKDTECPLSLVLEDVESHTMSGLETARCSDTRLYTLQRQKGQGSASTKSASSAAGFAPAEGGLGEKNDLERQKMMGKQSDSGGCGQARTRSVLSTAQCSLAEMSILERQGPRERHISLALQNTLGGGDGYVLTRSQSMVSTAQCSLAELPILQRQTLLHHQSPLERQTLLSGGDGDLFSHTPSSLSTAQYSLAEMYTLERQAPFERQTTPGESHVLTRTQSMLSTAQCSLATELPILERQNPLVYYTPLDGDGYLPPSIPSVLSTARCSLSSFQPLERQAPSKYKYKHGRVRNLKKWCISIVKGKTGNCFTSKKQ